MFQTVSVTCVLSFCLVFLAPYESIQRQSDVPHWATLLPFRALQLLPRHCRLILCCLSSSVFSVGLFADRAKMAQKAVTVGKTEGGRHECRQTSTAMASKMVCVQTWKDGKLLTLAQQAGLHCLRDLDGVGGLLPRFIDLKCNWPWAEPRHPSYHRQPSIPAFHIHEHFS